MNYRDTKKLAYRIIDKLIQSYLDVGNVSDWPEADSDKLDKAFKEIQDEMYKRGN